MKSLLLCLFSYNHPHYLANAVNSIDRHFPWGDRLIIDDGSSNPAMRPLLEDLAAESKWKYVIRDRAQTGLYGGYYQNMRYALDRALSEGYEYCLFFEDDEQFVWTKEDYPAYLETVFQNAPDAIQVQPLMFRRILPYAVSLETGTRALEYVRAARAYRGDRGFSTTAFWHLDRVRQHPDYRFIARRGDDLNTNSGYWMSRGYRLYLEVDPTVCILPWVTSRSVASARDLESGLSPENLRSAAPLLRDLHSAEISYLRTRAPNTLPFQEYFDLADGNSERPIWHQKGAQLERYYHLCRRTVAVEDQFRSSPLKVPVLEQWDVTAIPPSPTHMAAWQAESRQDKGAAAPGQPGLWGRLRRLARTVIPERIRKLRPTISPLDYLGYRRLRARLRRERVGLPFS